MSEPCPICGGKGEKPVWWTRAHETLRVQNDRMREQNTEVAAFLDGLAERADGSTSPRENYAIAADCRAMAARLRGET